MGNGVDNVKVSVVVPAYNAEKTIDRCLESLLAQDCPETSYEVIVVDDGSIDGTGEIIKRYPVKYVRQENRGPATARNRGAEEAAGEFLLFTDSDCVPSKNWIREMIRPFENPEVMAVKGAYLSDQPELTARFAQLEFEERFEMLKKVESIDMIDTYSAGFRRELFRKMGGFDTSFPVANNEDTELSYRLSAMGCRMVFNPDAVVRHLNHPDSVRRYARLKFWRGYWRMVVYKKFPDKMVKDTYTPQTLKLQTLLSLMFSALIPLAFAFKKYGICVLSGIGTLFMITTIPFLLMAVKKDPLIAMLSPFFLFLRGASIGAGALWGVVRRK